MRHVRDIGVASCENDDVARGRLETTESHGKDVDFLDKSNETFLDNTCSSVVGESDVANDENCGEITRRDENDYDILVEDCERSDADGDGLVLTTTESVEKDGDSCVDTCERSLDNTSDGESLEDEI